MYSDFVKRSTVPLLLCVFGGLGAASGGGDASIVGVALLIVGGIWLLRNGAALADKKAQP